MCEVEVEWLVGLGRLADVRLCLKGERLGEEEIGAVVFSEVRDGAGGTLAAMAEILLCVVAARRADGCAADVGVEAEGERLSAGAGPRAKMAFAHVDGLVTSGLQQAGQRDVAALESLPVPIRSALRTGIIGIGVDPVRRAMARGVLAGHNRDAGGRAHAHRAELVETNTAGGKTLHVRSAIKVVERITFRLAGGVREKRQRRIHYAHIVDEDHDDVGTRRRGSGASVGHEECAEDSSEETFHGDRGWA